jgi:hypothetical protein
MTSVERADRLPMRLRLGLLTLLAAVGLVAAGCGATSAPEPVRQLLSVSASARKTSALSTYRMETTMRMTMPGVSDPVEFTSTGAVDVVKHRQSATMDMSSLLAALGGGKDAPGAQDMKMEMVMDGLTVYLRMPFLAASLPAGKTWLSMDLAKMAQAQAQGLDFSSLLGNTYGDPSQMLGYLKAASGPLVEIGDEDLRGVETRHGRTTVDLAHYLKTLDPATRAKLGPVVDRFESMVGSMRPTMDVWVDDAGLIRRLGMDMAMPVPTAAGGSGDALRVEMTIDLFDFGADVAIVAPPAAEVVDAASLGLGG